jgi:hypothetical protein
VRVDGRRSTRWLAVHQDSYRCVRSDAMLRACRSCSRPSKVLVDFSAPACSALPFAPCPARLTPRAARRTATRRRCRSTIRRRCAGRRCRPFRHRGCCLRLCPHRPCPGPSAPRRPGRPPTSRSRQRCCGNPSSARCAPSRRRVCSTKRKKPPDGGFFRLVAGARNRHIYDLRSIMICLK